MKLIKRIKLLTLALFISISSCFSQVISRVDTIIKEPIYTSYYSYQIEAPSFVIYKLWQGGGKSSRVGLTFKSSLPHYNYTGSGYDIGHMCNAEDFAINRTTEELTFRYYNAVPQTPNLNRGIWKVNESQIRSLSQTDSLLICCGGCDYNNLIPTNCFKLVYSLSTGKLIEAYLFTNNSHATKQTDNNLSTVFTFSKLNNLYNDKK